MQDYKVPSLRCIVRAPKRGDRIVGLAVEQGFTLPEKPGSNAMDEFLMPAKSADPLCDFELSLSIIMLLGAGEYVVELSGGGRTGLFGLVVKGYAPSTAPDRNRLSFRNEENNSGTQVPDQAM